METVERLPRLRMADEILPSSFLSQPSRINALKKPTILIFEESSEMQAHYGQFLERDYNLLMVASAKRGIKMLQSLQVDLILFNIELNREAQAVDLLKLFRRLAAGALIPVVALTGYSGSDERALLSNARFDAYVARPFTLQKLREVIRRCIARRTVSIMHTVDLDMVRSGSWQPTRKKQQPAIFASFDPCPVPQP